MNTHRRPEYEQEIAHLAAQFLERESESKALITVTRAIASQNYHEVTIFLSILPQSQEAEALRSAKRLRSDFREYLRTHTRFHPTPTVDFILDEGEKNRQRIDELTRN